MPPVPRQNDSGSRPAPLIPLTSGLSDHASLPLPLTSLIGREREVTEACGLLRRDGVRLLTVTGPGGIGKTRLALRLATEMRQEFADGVCFVSLAPVTEPALVLSAIAQALGVREVGSRPLATQLATTLRARTLLLVLDNFEHTVPAGPAIFALLAGCSGLKVLATSRVPLHLSGEIEFPVPPLALPDPKRLPALAELAQTAAVSLFIERARAVRRDFALTEANASAVAELCVRLDGLPLALELAASRSKLLPPSALLALLDDRFTFLSGGPADLPVRLQTMHGAIAWSFDLLGEEERALFRRLAVFHGDFTLEAAEAVYEGPRTERCVERPAPSTTPRVPAGPVLNLLASLVDHSLLKHEDGPDGEPRVGMLETIRVFALEQLAASGEEMSVRRSHAAYYLALAEAGERAWQGPLVSGGEGAFDRLEAEVDNLRSALAYTIGQDVDAALRLAAALAGFWRARGYLREGRGWLEQALAAIPAASGARSSVAWAKALVGLGAIVRMQGDASRAVTLLEEALVFCRTYGDPTITAQALVDLADVALGQGWHARASAHYEEALALARQQDEPHLLAECLGNLGVLAYHRGDLDQAVSLLEEARTVQRERGDRSTLGGILWWLGEVARVRGDPTQAARLLKESLALTWAQRDKWNVVWSLVGLSAAVAACGQSEAAARLLGAAEALHATIGAPLAPVWRAHFDRLASVARVNLDETAFEAASSLGRALPLDQVVPWALAMDFDRTGTSPVPTASSRHIELTRRETDVLRLLVDGSSDREIGEALGIGVRTVETHVTNLLNKLGVASRTAAAAAAIRQGLAK